MKCLNKFGSDFDLDKSRLEKPIEQIYEEINASCNNFLRTQKGLQYLLMKYPKLSVEQAVREYHVSTYIIGI